MENLGKQRGKSARVANRRLHLRRRLSDPAYVELNEDKRGIVSNLGEGGLGIQWPTVLVEKHLRRIGFQLPQSENWVKLNGKIAWIGESQKQAGIQFIDLPETARIEIGEWVSAEPPGAKVPEEIRLEIVNPGPDVLPLLSLVSCSFLFWLLQSYAVRSFLNEVHRLFKKFIL